MKRIYYRKIHRTVVLVALSLLLTSSVRKGNTDPFQERRHLYEKIANEKGRAAALEYLLNFSNEILRSSVDSSILAYQWAAEETEKYDEDSLQAYCLGALQYLYRISGQFQKGVDAAHLERKVYSRASDSIANHLDNYLGLLYDDWGKFDSAQYYLKRYYLNNKLNDYQPGIMIASNNLGRLYSHLGEFEFATKYYSDALQLAEAAKDTSGIAFALHNLGNMFLNMNNVLEANQYLTRALEWSTAANMESIANRTRLVLARVEMRKGDLDVAENLCLEGLKYLEALKIYPKIVEGYHTLAEISFERSDYYTARNFLTKASSILGFVDQVDLRIKVHFTFAELFMKLNQPAKALQMMESARAEAESYQREDELPKIYHWLANFYRKEKQWEKSSNWSLQANKAAATWEARKQTRIVYEMQTDLALAKKNQEIQTLQALQEEQAKRNDLQRKLNIALVALLLGLLALLGFTWSSLRKSKIIALQHHQMHAQELKMKDQDHNLSLVQALVEGQESERKRIARELHDGLGSLITGIRLRLQSLVPENSKGLYNDELNEVEMSMGYAYEEVRRISHDMMPGVLAKYGLVEALENLCSQLQSTSEIEIDFNVIDRQFQLSDTYNIMIYRIFQELLNNILKHAAATHIYLQLSFGKKEITLMVEDNGKGFNTEEVENKSSIGLKNIESRVKFLQGSMEVDSQLGKGTSTIIYLPKNFE